MREIIVRSIKRGEDHAPFLTSRYLAVTLDGLLVFLPRKLVVALILRNKVIQPL
jgi:hypothetical protein